MSVFVSLIFALLVLVILILVGRPHIPSDEHDNETSGENNGCEETADISWINPALDYFGRFLPMIQDLFKTAVHSIGSQSGITNRYIKEFRTVDCSMNSFDLKLVDAINSVSGGKDHVSLRFVLVAECRIDLDIGVRFPFKSQTVKNYLSVFLEQIQGVVMVSVPEGGEALILEMHEVEHLNFDVRVRSGQADERVISNATNQIESLFKNFHVSLPLPHLSN